MSLGARADMNHTHLLLPPNFTSISPLDRRISKIVSATTALKGNVVCTLLSSVNQVANICIFHLTRESQEWLEVVETIFECINILIASW